MNSPTINTKNAYYAFAAMISGIISIIAPLPDKLLIRIIAGVLIALLTGFFTSNMKKASIYGGAFGFILVFSHFFMYRQTHPFDIISVILIPLVVYGALSAVIGAALAHVGYRLRHLGASA